MESPLPFALSRVFGRIDPEQFEECFRTWTREAYEQTDGEVAQVDGKTLCGSGDAATGQEPRHLVEAWACEQGLTLGQRRSGGGSNEIKAIPELLETLVLEGCNAWIDAMGCQTDIAEAICEAGADYVLRVKDNQEGLRADIEQCDFLRLITGCAALRSLPRRSGRKTGRP